jgi:hypothetical protein
MPARSLIRSSVSRSLASVFSSMRWTKDVGAVPAAYKEYTHDLAFDIDTIIISRSFSMK